MSPDPPPPAAAVVRPRRSFWAVQGERAIEALVRLSGVSAIVFVAAIFFFVLREAAPVLVKDQFSLWQFLFSTEWYPTSAVNVRYGTFALTVGTLSVTALAMVIAVPFGLGAAIYLSEFCAPRVRETLKITDRAYIIKDGGIFRSGNPAELTEDPDVRRSYLGEQFRLN